MDSWRFMDKPDYTVNSRAGQAKLMFSILIMSRISIHYAYQVYNGAEIQIGYGYYTDRIQLYPVKSSPTAYREPGKRKEEHGKGSQ